MKIAIISKLWERSDPFSTGGTGAVVGNLAEGLVKRGHKVTLFASGNSKTKAALVSVTPRPYGDKNHYSEIKEFGNISRAFSSSGNFDIIDCHVEHKGLFFSRLVKTPVVHSLEYGEIPKEEIAFLKEHRRENFIMISKAMAKRLSFLNIAGVIHNGLDFSRFPFNEKPEDYFLFLGRLSPQKGPGIAIEAARSLKLKLILAGKTSRTDQRYLDKYVWPYVDNKRIIYAGEVGFKEKIRLLKSARAVLHPHTYFEAFGLVPVEAQACGTPAIVFPGGASREIVVSGRTGFIVKNIEGLMAAVKKIEGIDRRACRKFVAEKFPVEKMIDGYEKTYKRVIVNHKK
ncbi:MAG: glycosyltransferase family 4 protein [Candidatus Falkowbacteria bacterium]